MIKKEKTFFSVLWTITVVLMVLLLFSHTYNDIVITTRHGINFWSILKNGDFFQFYQVNILESGNEFYSATQSCAYNILVYLVFAIWNIPLALLMAFTNIDVMNNVWCLSYAKLLPILALLVCAWLVKRILDLLRVPEKKQHMLVYLFFSSALVISVVFIMSQYDVIGLIFQLLGLQAFLEKKDRKFVFWFGIAFCFKFFSLVIFLPLLLLRQKKIGPCIGSLAGMGLPLLITKLPFLFAPGTGDLMALEFIQSMLSYTTNYMNLFIVVYILILVWCYLRNGKNLPHDAVWACFAGYAAFFGLCNAYPYWSILLAPFAVLAIAGSPEHFYLNLLLETFGYAGLMVSNMLKYTWCYFGNTMKSMLFRNFSYEDSLIYLVISKLSDNYLAISVFHSIFVAAMAAMAFTSYPRRRTVSLAKWNDQAGYHDALILRTCIVSVLCLLPVVSLFI